MSKPQAETKMRNKVATSRRRIFLLAFCLLAFSFGTACRYDMQDQPRLRSYKSSEFFSDKKAMRDLPKGTVARGRLNENKALYTGKKENADPNIQVETTLDGSGNTLVSSFPNDVEEIPIPVTKELLDRGEERYKIYCIVCHGPVGKGDGMVVRRGYPQPPTYHDDRMRNAPVGHFFDVMTNGWGKMNSYSAQISVTDRWAIVAHIRALQLSQNPDSNAATKATETKEGDVEPKAPEAKTTDEDNKKDEASSDGGEKGGKE